MALSGAISFPSFTGKSLGKRLVLQATHLIAAITRYQDEREELLTAGINNVFNFYTEAGTGFAEESLQLIGHSSVANP